MTGRASGIGLSISKLMAKEGAKVVIADFNEAGAKEAAENINKQGGEAAGVFLDAGQADSIQAAVDFTIEQYGTLRYLLIMWV
ncbi:SDR family NAD(P)-dependent oxidoreductase [Peribacillus frigoritolerans]